MWPINRVSDPAMVHEILLNVIDVPRKIKLIPDLMFPIPPHASLTLGLAAGSNVFVFCQSPREPGLDERPAQWMVGVARWQALYQMNWAGRKQKKTLSDLFCLLFP